MCIVSGGPGKANKHALKVRDDKVIGGKDSIMRVYTISSLLVISSRIID